MSDQNLFQVLKTLGYRNDSIRAITAAAEGAEAAEIGKMQAERDRSMTPLTPIAAAAQSPRHAAMLRQTLGIIRHASRHMYELPLDRPVNLNEVSAAIRGGSIENRMAIKGNLAQLGLVR